MWQPFSERLLATSAYSWSMAIALQCQWYAEFVLSLQCFHVIATFLLVLNHFVWCHQLYGNLKWIDEFVFKLKKLNNLVWFYFFEVKFIELKLTASHFVRSHSTSCSTNSQSNRSTDQTASCLPNKKNVNILWIEWSTDGRWLTR